MTPEEIAITVANQTVLGKLFSPKSTTIKPAILLLHGWTGKPNEGVAKALAEKGFPALTISFRGHAPSDGNIISITTEDSLADATGAYDLLKERLPGNTPIVAVGNSYGGYITARLTQQRDLLAVSLRVPANYTDDDFAKPKWGRGHEDPAVGEWRRQVMSYEKNDALLALHQFSGQIQIIEAKNDELIPDQTVQNYVTAISDSAKLDFIMAKGWPHSLGSDKTRQKQFRDWLLAWLENRVMPSTNL